MFSQLVHREELQVAVEMNDREGVHIGLAPLHYPSLWSLIFVCPGVDVTLHLSGQQIRTLYAQLHARLVVAPRVERAKARAIAETR